MTAQLAQPVYLFMFQTVYGNNIIKGKPRNIKHMKKEKHKNCPLHAPYSTQQRGYIILEAFLAVMVIGIALAVFLDIGALSIKTATSIKKSSQANFLLKEAMETTRNFRDGTTWSTNGLGTTTPGNNNPYHFVLDTSTTPNTWNLTPGTETIDIFTRKIIFDQVYRDANNNIVSSGGTLDADTKKVTATISWPDRTMNLITYLTNWK